MILMAGRMIKILLLLAVLAADFFMFRKKLSKQKVRCLFVLTVIFALAANMIAGFLPPLTDQVTLTALGKKCAEAKAPEVYLAGYAIDGEEFNSLDYLQIVEGHWFWSGETYAWRPETDSRQPDGVTRTVVLNIPVGWSRTLNFSGNAYRGSVEISVNGKVWSVDTYSENTSVVPVRIGRSETSALIINQIRYLAVYAILLLAWFFAVGFMVRIALRSPEQTRTWLDHNTGKFIYLAISIITFCLMFRYADNFSLWLDEMYQVKFVKDSLAEAFLYCLELKECSPPLALLCSAIWYRIAPYGEQWLLLISMVLSVASVYTMGLIGEKIGDIYCGILAAIMMAFSTTVWSNAAYEFRAYPYFLMLSTLVLYFYIRKNEPNRSRGRVIAFSVSLICLAMTHYFGMLACAEYFFGDLFLWHKKQVKWKEGFLYLLPGVCSAGWLLAVAIYQGRSYVSNLTWYSVPTLPSVKSLLMFLTGQTEFLYWVLLFSVAHCIARHLRDRQDKRREFKWPDFYQRFLSSELVITVVLMFIYGVYINSKSTLWTNRYFMFLIPAVTTLLAMSLYDFSACLEKHKIIIKRTVILFVAMILSFNCLTSISTSTTSEPFREAADWLYQQDNYIFNDTTVIIGTSGYLVTDGWSEYYITRQGRRDALNVFSQGSLNQDEVLNYDRIYISYAHDNVSSWLQTLLDENYIKTQDSSTLKLCTYIRK